MVEDRIWLTFSTGQSAEAFVELAQYHIETDRSYWPVEHLDVREGSYLSSYNTASFERGTHHTFVQVEVSLSAKRREVQRSFGKIDDRLSYIGGLFEMTFLALGILLYSFNTYRYELMVS